MRNVPAAGEAQETLRPLPGETYFDGPFMVFTAAYHLRRGYCCNNDCGHCPYKDPAGNNGAMQSS